VKAARPSLTWRSAKRLSKSLREHDLILDGVKKAEPSDALRTGSALHVSALGPRITLCGVPLTMNRRPPLG